MADEVDDAQLRTERLIQTGIQRVREGLSRRDAPWCEDCGGPISPARRACLPGVDTCVECQHKREFTRRHHRRP
ncbi:TPA: TraR/DksA C4-type zinc finger protein [Salmonella enterica]|nr:conjugal transfer protein TraR [Salmonella enterica subsp. enterica serovar Montevideo]MCH5723073.1 TraR/DksA C4-type zinc finger protein [Salmonella enterica]EGH0794891.1 conjugal transfer protein TraR [Salmonella enterica subsp. enterica serovar Montevideo]EJT8386375.1 TraR/DksA C4-type zinc finger protein [Salmonella enterica subsp. enterica serovar Montevideo]ELM0668181.1 TraR/DksA C4-type zinc finger protein [Salmonella enterica subsp. enterica serovar Montevideo]